jgi:hypothetical protein
MLSFLNEFLYDSLSRKWIIEIVSEDDIKERLKDLKQNIKADRSAKDATTRLITPKKWQLYGLLYYYLENDKMPENSEKFMMGISNEYRKKGSLGVAKIEKYAKTFEDTPFEIITPKETPKAGDDEAIPEPIKQKRQHLMMN